MKGLDFLKKASLASNEVVKPATARTTVAKARNPELADIRVYKDGAVFPSVALIKEFDLQYRAKEVEPKGNGFDVFKSTDFPNTQHWPKENRIIFIASVDKGQGKLDLFGRTTYNEETGAASDVLTQGAATFGKQLLEQIKEVYGEEPNEEGYIDLMIARDNGFNTDNGKYYIPKVVSRGTEKGSSTVVTREDITLYPLVPASWADVAPEQKEEATPIAEPETKQASEEDAISMGSVSVDKGAAK